MYRGRLEFVQEVLKLVAQLVHLFRLRLPTKGAQAFDALGNRFHENIIAISAGCRILRTFGFGGACPCSIYEFDIGVQSLVRQVEIGQGLMDLEQAPQDQGGMKRLRSSSVKHIENISSAGIAA